VCQPLGYKVRIRRGQGLKLRSEVKSTAQVRRGQGLILGSEVRVTAQVRRGQGLILVGGVNHCRLHCRLARSRGLMRRGKYGAVIGQKTRFFVCA